MARPTAHLLACRASSLRWRRRVSVIPGSARGACLANVPRRWIAQIDTHRSSARRRRAGVGNRCARLGCAFRRRHMGPFAVTGSGMDHPASWRAEAGFLVADGASPPSPAIPRAARSWPLGDLIRHFLLESAPSPTWWWWVAVSSPANSRCILHGPWACSDPARSRGASLLRGFPIRKPALAVQEGMEAERSPATVAPFAPRISQGGPLGD